MERLSLYNAILHTTVTAGRTNTLQADLDCSVYCFEFLHPTTKPMGQQVYPKSYARYVRHCSSPPYLTSATILACVGLTFSYLSAAAVPAFKACFTHTLVSIRARVDTGCSIEAGHQVEASIQVCAKLICTHCLKKEFSILGTLNRCCMVNRAQ